MYNDEILVLNERILDPHVGTSRNKIISGPNDIDKERSKKSVDRCKKKINKMIVSGKYRNVEGKDKAKITNLLKIKEFINRLFPMLPKRINIQNGMKYKIFKYEGLTIMVISNPIASKLVDDIGDSESALILKKLRDARCAYVLLVRNSDSKIIFKEITLYPKRISMKNRVEYDI